ncbi:MAG: hypothetical protein ACPGSO_01455 [Vicingaceae bacterium]
MLNILNYSDHPTRIGYTVFRFNTEERSDYFKELLNAEAILFEFSYDEEHALYLFGVKKGDFKKAANANYLVSAKYRNKIFPNKYFRWGIIAFGVLMVILAIIGAILKT